MYPIEVSHLKIVRYRRKSTEGEDRQVASLPDQAVALDEVVARLHIAPSQIAADFGESRSAKLSDSRPDFQSMVAMIERGHANAILAWHPDRLSRNLGDVDTLIRLIENRQLAAIITPQYIFGNTPLEKYMLISECTRAKLENDNKGVNVRRGLLGKVRKGWRPGVAKIGYLNNTARERGNRDIVPDPERFDKVKHLLHLFLTGAYSVRRLHRVACKQLLLRTRKTKRQGGKQMSLSHVYYVLNDPFYCGKFWWKHPDTGERELHPGKHLPMITEEEFWQIQALLGNRVRPRSKTHLFAYTALMKCGECGSAITAEEKWQIICGRCKTKFASQNKAECPGCGAAIADLEPKKLLHYVYYHCAKNKGICMQKGVRVQDLESQIEGILARFNVHEKYVRWALETLKADSESGATTRIDIERDIKREQAKLKDELAELNRFIIKQESAGWNLMTKQEALGERQRILAQLKTLEPHPEGDNQSVGDGLDATADVLDYACHARFWLKEGTNEQKREIFSALGSNLTLKDKKLWIDLKYPLPEIERMIEIAPEIISSFEPALGPGNIERIPVFADKIPSLLRGLNAIRTYFATSGERFWQPRCPYSPSIRSPAVCAKRNIRRS